MGRSVHGDDGDSDLAASRIAMVARNACERKRLA
jgi:hypothetical protein